MLMSVILPAALLASATASCLSGWQPYNNDCYWLSDYTASWRSARTSCLSFGGDLVSIHSAGEDKFIFNNLTARDAWIGLSDLDRENNFIWADGTPLNYTNWMDGQPNNLLDQDCVNIQDLTTGQWDDNHCVENKPFVCRAPGDF